MMQRREGFTIIELLVVVSIIALLVGILLPAIGKARDSALVNVSRNNLRQMGVAHQAYAADWGDRQITYVRDNLGMYGGDTSLYNEAIYGNVDGGYEGRFDGHPGLIAGNGYDTDRGTYRPWGFWPEENNWAFQAIIFPGGPGGFEYFGWFRFGHQSIALNKYLNGKYNDPVFFAPKDPKYVEYQPCLEVPGEFAAGEGSGGIGPTFCNTVTGSGSYCLSAAALFSPQVFSWNKDTEKHWRKPWEMPTGYKVPSFAQVTYPTLKTHMLEHSWLQNSQVPCNPAFSGCEAYYFNHGFSSIPVTLFFDGSVRMMSVLEAMSSDRRVKLQDVREAGLWSRDTDFGTDGYLIGDGYDFADTSYHILTIDGARGRDTIGKE